MIIVWSLRLGAYLFYRIFKMKKDSRFDEMRKKFIKIAAFWILQAISVWVLLLPYIFFMKNEISMNAKIWI